MDKQLQNMRAKSSVHDRPRAPHLTLGAGGCSGESSGSARQQPQCNGCPPSDGAASVRHDEVLDGSNALPHEKVEKGSHRDGAQRARLQHEARDDDHGRTRIAGGDAGVRPAFSRPNQACMKLLVATEMRDRFHRIRSSTAAKCAGTPQLGRTFRTAWARSLRHALTLHVSSYDSIHRTISPL
jgi:hypothetical protein